MTFINSKGLCMLYALAELKNCLQVFTETEAAREAAGWFAPLTFLLVSAAAAVCRLLSEWWSILQLICSSCMTICSVWTLNHRISSGVRCLASDGSGATSSSKAVWRTVQPRLKERGQTATSTRRWTLAKESVFHNRIFIKLKVNIYW